MESIDKEIRGILMAIEGPELRDGLTDTPRRVEAAYREMLDGYEVNIEALLTKTFEEDGHDQIAGVKDIQTWSLCEHHLLPFALRAHVLYLPTDKVVGVSKLERLVIAHAHRLQLQERIARCVAEDIMKYLKPQGVAVVIYGEHCCMRCRGVKSTASQVVTSVMLGAFREDHLLRMEVLSLLGLH